MRIPRLPSLVLAVAGLLVLGLTLAPPAAGQAQRGGILRLGYTVDAVTLNNGLTSQLGATMLGTKIFSGLLEYDWDFVPRPGLAERWETSSDGLRYTFHLRRDVTFHDGKPLTSADVKFTILNVIKPMHPRGAPSFVALDGIDTPDDHTVVFRLKHPFAPFIRVFQVSDAPILPRHLYEGTDIRNNPWNAKPVGTGPFKFKEWVKGSHVILERNERYFRKGQPYLDRIVYQVLPDQATRVAAFETNQVDLVPYTGIPNVEASRIRQLAHAVMTTSGYEAQALHMWLEFNLRKAPMNDVAVRRAIAHAIDKNFVHQNIWFGIGKVATGAMNSAHKAFYTADVPTYEYSLEKANRLLDEAGHKRGADGVRFKVTQDFIPYGEEYVRLAEYIREQLKKIGIEVTTRTSDTPGWFNRIWTQYDFYWTSNFVGNLADPSIGMPRYYVSTMGKPGVPFTNSMNYQNPEIDRLFTQAAREMNTTRRRDVFVQIQKILAADLPLLPILEYQPTTFHHRDLQEVVTGPFGVYDSFDRVWWKRPR
jgi:peptide/nickel transport system substrate-binding protein